MAQSQSRGPRDRLDESLKRVLDAIAHVEERQARWIEDWHRRTGDVRRTWRQGRSDEGWGGWERLGVSFAEQLQRDLHRKLERKLAKRRYRQLRREARARAYAGPTGWLPGLLNGGVAIGCAAAAIAHPVAYGFMGYVGLGFGFMAIRSFSRWQRASQEPRAGTLREEEEPREGKPFKGQPQVGVSPGPDPRLGRVDALCDKILAELKAAPRALQDFVHQPDETVKSLRLACHELVRRELELRAAAPEVELDRLRREREGLAARQARERDEVVRQRLSGALAALDEQLVQRAELATAASRLDAEYTRLYYTLEGLYTQVLRVKS
ncbi:MAG: hypothetical protein JO306_01365, partial [Gemmatimonadetes bacterium]|nr:hypothetical protein [Gemmatimonadota bacterium]